jgi:hypothetical protein
MSLRGKRVEDSAAIGIAVIVVPSYFQSLILAGFLRSAKRMLRPLSDRDQK